MHPWPAIYDLFDQVWPGTPDRIQLAANLGWDWTEVSTPFAAMTADRAVAHAGVLSLPVRIDGQDRELASLHAVCTRPGSRGRGLARSQVERALSFADARWTAAQLSTDKPGVYEPHGFRAIELHRFRVPAPMGVFRKPLSPLSHRRQGDAELVHQLLSERDPVSDVFCPTDDGWLVGINAVLFWSGFAGEPGGLGYDEGTGSLIAWEDHGDTIRLLDVIAPVLPELDEVLACIPGSWTWAELCFTPDRFDVDAEPVDWDDDEIFMVRGDWPVPEEPFAISPLWMT